MKTSAPSSIAAPIDWDHLCARVPKGWYLLGALALSGGLWSGVIRAVTWVF